MMTLTATVIVAAFIIIVIAGYIDMTVDSKLSHKVVVSSYLWLASAVFWLFAIVLHWGKV